MASFGSLFAAIGRALPGFYEGRQQAIQDNWKDLENYNNVQAGQLSNAWTEATWEDRLTNVHNQRLNNSLQLGNSALNFNVRQALQPYFLGQAQMAQGLQPYQYGLLMSLLRDPGAFGDTAQSALQAAGLAGQLSVPNLGGQG